MTTGFQRFAGWAAVLTAVVAAGRWAIAAAVLLIIVYVARLAVLDPQPAAIRAAAPIVGLALVPAFYVQIGRALLQGSRPPTAAAVAEATAQRTAEATAA